MRALIVAAAAAAAGCHGCALDPVGFVPGDATPMADLTAPADLTPPPDLAVPWDFGTCEVWRIPPIGRYCDSLEMCVQDGGEAQSVMNVDPSWHCQPGSQECPFRCSLNLSHAVAPADVERACAVLALSPTATIYCFVGE